MKRYWAAVLALSVPVCAFASCGDTKSSESGKGSYEDALEEYVEAFNSRSGEDFLKAAYPDFMVDALKSGSEDEFDAAIAQYDSMIEDQFADYEERVGSNVKISVDIKEAEKLSDEDLTSFQKTVDGFCGQHEIDDEHKLTEGYKLKVNTVVHGDDGEENEESSFIVVCVDDNEWMIN